MKPPVPLVLSVALQTLEEIIRDETNAHKTFYFNRLKIILEVIRRDWDDSVAARVEEIDDISNFLRKGVMIAPAELRTVLVDALNKAESGSKNLKISALDEMLNQLLIVLIDLHKWLEETSTEESRILLTEVWSFLRRYARHRAVEAYMW
jgi:hypothetical protein